jgi:hypothetical protein
VTVGTTPAEVKTDSSANLDVSSVDAKAIENLPVFDQDILTTMSRFLDASAIGTTGPTLVVNGVEMNSLTVSASAIQQVKINRDPYSAEYPGTGRGRIEVVLKPGSQEYHGIANFVFRDSALNARNAFAMVKPDVLRYRCRGASGSAPSAFSTREVLRNDRWLRCRQITSIAGGSDAVRGGTFLATRRNEAPRSRKIGSNTGWGLLAAGMHLAALTARPPAGG